MTSLSASLRAGKTVCAVSIASGSPAVVEIAGDLGFSAVVLDARHASVSPFSGELEALVRAGRAGGVPCIVRPPDATPGTLNRSLNDGADGVMVPAVENVDDARAAVAATRYPPLGRRGAAPVVRAARYGLQAWDDYHAATNSERLVLASLESAEAVAAAGAITAVEGIDGVVLDAMTLALDTGAASPAPDVLEGVAAAVAAAESAGAFCGALAADPADAAGFADAGCRLVVVGSDLAACAARTRALRASLDAVPTTLSAGAVP
jgi:2-keto-3-deoxy-L-rhamnonate aldolase RhmA